MIAPLADAPIYCLWLYRHSPHPEQSMGATARPSCFPQIVPLPLPSWDTYSDPSKTFLVTLTVAGTTNASASFLASLGRFCRGFLRSPKGNFTLGRFNVTYRGCIGFYKGLCVTTRLVSGYRVYRRFYWLGGWILLMGIMAFFSGSSRVYGLVGT